MPAEAGAEAAGWVLVCLRCGLGPSGLLSAAQGQGGQRQQSAPQIRQQFIKSTKHCRPALLADSKVHANYAWQLVAQRGCRASAGRPPGMLAASCHITTANTAHSAT